MSKSTITLSLLNNDNIDIECKVFQIVDASFYEPLLIIASDELNILLEI